jgi:hypothetical protein
VAGIDSIFERLEHPCFVRCEGIAKLRSLASLGLAVFAPSRGLRRRPSPTLPEVRGLLCHFVKPKTG